MRTFVQKLPWLSLSLLFFAYNSFGWALSASTASKSLWAFAVLLPLLLARILTDPLGGVRRRVFLWSVGTAWALIITITLVSLILVVLFLAHILAYVLVILSAEILARLDLQTAGFSRSQSFWILTFFALIALELGWLLHYLVK